MPRTARLTAGLAAAACVVSLAGCSDDPDPKASQDPVTTAPSPPSSAAASTEPADDPGTEPTDDPQATSTTTATPPPDDDPSDSSPKRAKLSKIKASALPGFNAEWTWKQTASGPGPGQDVASVCMQSSLTAIGGVTGGEYRTDFVGTKDDQSWAVQLTVVFPDDLTATRSVTVLDAWQRKCHKNARSLGLKDVEVSGITEVETPVGAGKQWLVTYGPVAGDRDATWFQAEGYVRDGDTLTYLILTTAGQDYNYEPGHQPIDEALRVAARRLLETR